MWIVLSSTVLSRVCNGLRYWQHSESQLRVMANKFNTKIGADILQTSKGWRYRSPGLAPYVSIELCQAKRHWYAEATYSWELWG
jgi:hypothetical protein